MFRQRSIQNLVRTTGVGVHSGRRVELTLRPAAPNTGIVFHRVLESCVAGYQLHILSCFILL